MIHSKIKIAFFDTKPYDRRFFDEANQNARFGFDIRYYETRLAPASAKIAEGAQVVCAFVNDDLSAETIRTLHDVGVELVAMRCAGYNNVNLTEAHGKLRVVRVPEYSPHAVAEYTLALLLTLNRNLHRAYCRVRENNFSINGFIGFDVYGKTVGIIGTGKIGRTFAELLQGFGVKILAYDLYPNEAEAKRLNIEYVPLEELFRRSDIISLHCPLTP
ncbi:MAG: NAD(P)-dependent oxidoreductase, partial [Victivallales bacterium]|nr:NAD(P)-dependent oxidoreductase [Victivallales bacterium]